MQRSAFLLLAKRFNRVDLWFRVKIKIARRFLGWKSVTPNFFFIAQYLVSS